MYVCMGAKTSEASETETNNCVFDGVCNILQHCWQVDHTCLNQLGLMAKQNVLIFINSDVIISYP